MEIRLLTTDMTFNDVFEDSDTFLSEWALTPFSNTNLGELLDDTTLELIYILLYNKYGNNEIANFSVNQFKSKLFGIVWAYGPVWLKKLQIQEKIQDLDLDDADVYKGSTALYNHAMHDETAPSTDTEEEMPYINDQNVTKYKKAPLEGLMLLADTLNDRLTDDFVNKFRKLFKTFVSKYAYNIFVTTGEEEENG